MKIGDIVAVVNDNLEGTVTKIMANEIHFISRDEFEYIYQKKQLTIIQNTLEEAIKNTNIKPKNIRNKKIKKNKASNIPIFDLHIQKIQYRHQHLTSGQKLEIQIAEVSRIIHKMVIKRHKRFILIHGLGQGVLKSEIIKILNTKGLTYSEASYQNYGQGAIEIETK